MVTSASLELLFPGPLGLSNFGHSPSAPPSLSCPLQALVTKVSPFLGPLSSLHPRSLFSVHSCVLYGHLVGIVPCSPPHTDTRTQRGRTSTVPPPTPSITGATMLFSSSLNVRRTEATW